MKTKKLSLNDFESVETAELLEAKGGNNSGGAGPCGTRINGQGYEESPLPTSEYFPNSSGGTGSFGSTIVGAVANRIWKGVIGSRGSFFSSTPLNNYGTPPNNIRWFNCPDGTVIPFDGSGNYEPGYSEGYGPSRPARAL